ncbi:MAG TPA: class II aldolase/adducin family protein [Oligoflexia bacterium]|nr:class II aldolase/adducin family protein [Oligoflexia bacterium]HMR23729.1 class II aldolase/adducin family protein [Oligoflexia bacterium]
MFYLSSRKSIVQVHKLLYAKGYGVGNDGNTSIRVSAQEMLITPTGFDKSKLKPFDISIVCLKTGKHLKGPKPSSEYQLHLATYQHNPKVKAIVHSHPPYSIACSLSGISLEEPILPEVIIALGKVPTCSYTTPGTHAIAQQAALALKENQCIILERHGVVSASKSTIDNAYTQLERVEHSAKILWLSHAIAPPSLIQNPELESLINIRKEIQNG